MRTIHLLPFALLILSACGQPAARPGPAHTAEFKNLDEAIAQLQGQIQTTRDAMVNFRQDNSLDEIPAALAAQRAGLVELNRTLAATTEQLTLADTASEQAQEWAALGNWPATWNLKAQEDADPEVRKLDNQRLHLMIDHEVAIGKSATPETLKDIDDRLQVTEKTIQERRKAVDMEFAASMFAQARALADAARQRHDSAVQAHDAQVATIQRLESLLETYSAMEEEVDQMTVKLRELENQRGN